MFSEVPVQLSDEEIAKINREANAARYEFIQREVLQSGVNLFVRKEDTYQYNGGKLEKNGVEIDADDPSTF